MRAIVYDRYGGPEQLRLDDLPAPSPRRGEVVVAVLACSLNLSDWEYLTGEPAYARLAGLFRPRQRVLGSDIVGKVVAVGPGVTDLAVGQRVMADVVMQRGGLAELSRLPAAACAPVPQGLSDELAACLPQAGAIAAQGMEGVAAGERVLINGAGGGSGTPRAHLLVTAPQSVAHPRPAATRDTGGRGPGHPLATVCGNYAPARRRRHPSASRPGSHSATAALLPQPQPSSEGGATVPAVSTGSGSVSGLSVSSGGAVSPPVSTGPVSSGSHSESSASMSPSQSWSTPSSQSSSAPG
jgi:hypothetical protein